jgi:hypothetical protein
MAPILNPKPNGMTPHSLFSIIIKLFGVYFIKQVVDLFPNLLFYFRLGFIQGSSEDRVLFMYILVTILILVLAVKLFLFHSDWIIQKLRLSKSIKEEVISVNIHRTAVIHAALVILGGWLIVTNAPYLIWQILQFIQSKPLAQPLNVFYHLSSFEIFRIIFMIIVGYLIIRYSSRLTTLIEYRRRRY